MQANRRRTVLKTMATCGVMVATMSTAALAADVASYPTKPVTVVVPFTPGGSFDVIARQIATRLGDAWKQPVVIENKAGAGGNLGALGVVNARPDGYTLLFWGDGVLANPLLYPNPPFNAIEDLSAVAQVATTPQVLVSHPTTSLKTMADVVASTEVLNYGTAGNGTPGHLAAEWMRREGAAQLNHIPYRGGGPALTDLMGNQIQLVFTGLPAALTLIRTGRVHAVAVSSAERVSLLPDVPTVGETIKGYEVDTWFGFMAPKNTPLEIREKIASDVAKILQEPELRKRLEEGGFVVKTSTPQELSVKMEKDLAFWKALVTESGAKAE